MSNALMAKFEAGGQPVELDAATVRDYLTNGSGRPSDQEVAMFIKLCQYQGLNPFLREAYLIKYSDKAPASTVVGKDAFTRRAAEMEECKGWKAGVCCVDKKGGYVEREGTIVLPEERLVGAWCEVKSTLWEEPFKQTVQLDEYHQHNTMWNSKPATMIRKVAIVQTLREAFPRQFQGMYDQSEMSVDGTLPETEIPQDPAQQPIDAAKKKAVAELIGNSDMKRIERARQVLNSYGYSQCKDILNCDYELILTDLQAALMQLEAEEAVIDVEPKEPEQMTIEEGGANDGAGQAETAAG